MLNIPCMNLNRPGAALAFAVGAVDQNGMPLVDAAGDIGVAPGAEDWGGPSIGVDAGEVVGWRAESSGRRSSMVSGVVEEEGALGLVRSAAPRRRISARRT